jgi:hypothetical protein
MWHFSLGVTVEAMVLFGTRKPVPGLGYHRRNKAELHPMSPRVGERDKTSYFNYPRKGDIDRHLSTKNEVIHFFVHVPLIL